MNDIDVLLIKYYLVCGAFESYVWNLRTKKKKKRIHWTFNLLHALRVTPFLFYTCMVSLIWSTRTCVSIKFSTKTNNTKHWYLIANTNWFKTKHHKVYLSLTHKISKHSVDTTVVIKKKISFTHKYLI